MRLSSIKNLFRHSLMQHFNQLNYEKNLDKLPIKAPYAPVECTVNVESACTNRCKFCIWHSEDTKRPYWHYRLSYDDFVRIADKFAKLGTPHLHFCGTGEPFLNKELLKMAEYARKKRFKTSVLSNMTKCVTPYLDGIARAGFKYVNTDIDSGDPKQFEELRCRSSWDTVTSNMQRLAELRKELNADYELGAWCIAMRCNYHTFKDLAKKCADIGIDNLMFSYLIPFEMNEITSKDNVIQRTDTEIIKEIDEAIEYGRSLGLKVTPPSFPPLKNTRQNCVAAWRCVMVNLPNDKIPKDRWIGNISLHCFLAHLGEAYSFGNILHDDFDDIWNGEKFQELRRKMLTDAPEICKECPSL